jgi:hypothetical protein
MLAKDWLEDHVGSANDAAHARLAAASAALATHLHDVHQAIARRGGEGLDYARAIGGGMREESYRLGRSTRSLVAERPIESVVIIGLAAFALGWLWRRSRESSPAHVVAPRRPPAKRKSRA